MKKALPLIFLFCLFFSYCKKKTDAHDPTILSGKWVQKASISQSARSIAQSFVINNKAYVFGGSNGVNVLNDLWEYDPANDHWTQKTSPAFHLMGGVAMVINNKAYVGVGNAGGGVSGFVKAWWEYDVVQDKWTQKSDFPGDERLNGIAIAVGDSGFVGLGASWLGATRFDWWSYNAASDRWNRQTNNPSNTEALSYPAGFELNGNLYVGTGNFEHFREWWAYNVVADVWTRKADFPGQRVYGASGFVLGGLGYVAGGMNECWSYDAGQDRWKQVAFFGTRSAGIAFAVGSHGYYSGGGGSDDLWEFTP